MEKGHIITIAGKPGSGKSTTSKNVAKSLAYQHFSSGDLFRSIGKERGVDLLSANLLAEKETEIDHLVDERLRELGKTGDELVIDSRTAWHWIPHSFRVYLDLNLTVAAKRILAGMDHERRVVEHVPDDPEEYAAILQNRLDSEARRYQSLYGINPYDTGNYDLIVDTEKNDMKAAEELIIREYKKWLH